MTKHKQPYSEYRFFISSCGPQFLPFTATETNDGVFTVIRALDHEPVVTNADRPLYDAARALIAAGFSPGTILSLAYANPKFPVVRPVMIAELLEAAHG